MLGAKVLRNFVLLMLLVGEDFNFTSGNFDFDMFSFLFVFMALD
jgi:hypothetical protein